MERNKNKIGVKYDRILLLTVMILVSLGIVMVYSSSSIYSKEHFGSQYHFLGKHLVYVLVGVAFLIFGMNLRHDFLKKLAYPMLILSFLMLLFLLLSEYGVQKSGTAARWISVSGFSFQPAEFAKVALVIFLATFISNIGERITSFKKGFLPCTAVSGLLLLLIVWQPDFGMAITLSLVVLVMLFVAGTKISFLLATALLAVPPVVLLVVKSGYRIKRVLAFWDPWSDPLGSGFQIIQSFIAFSRGGFWGQGLGDGKQKLLYLPEAHTDFIFSVIGEELGFIGVLSVIALFCFLLFRGFWVSLKVRDSFSVVLATGIVAMIGIQAFVNIGVSMGLLPTKGLTLPFISCGGSFTGHDDVCSRTFIEDLIKDESGPDV